MLMVSVLRKPSGSPVVNVQRNMMGLSAIDVKTRSISTQIALKFLNFIRFKTLLLKL